MNPPSAFTGRARERKTNRMIHFSDVASKWIITIGGIGTILAVLTVAVFLVWVVIPLFQEAKGDEAVAAALVRDDGRALVTRADEYRTIGWALYPDEKLYTFRLDNGQKLREIDLFPDTDAKMTALDIDPFGEAVLAGFDDGTIRLGKIGFVNDIKNKPDVPEALHDIAPGETVLDGSDMVEITPEGQFRYTHLEFSFEEPVVVDKGSESGIQMVAIAPRGGSPKMVVLTDDGKLLGTQISRKKNLLTGKTRVRVRNSELPYTADPALGGPVFMLLNDRGDNLVLAWKDGTAARFMVPSSGKGRVLETIDLVPDPAYELTQLSYLLGRRTLVVADSGGGISGYFAVDAQSVTGFKSQVHNNQMVVFRDSDTAAEDGWRRTGEIEGAAAREGAGPGGLTIVAPDAATIDDYLTATPLDQKKLVLAKVLVAPGDSARVTALGMSARSRIFGAGYEDGTIKLFHMTSANNMFTTRIDAGEGAIRNISIAPKNDAIVALSGAELHEWDIDMRYPEASVASLFGKVWYESYPAGAFVWQSSSATDDAEPKYGLIPLIFGTLKATCYSMIFGAPLALLAAVYTSEFLKPSIKARIKPTIELMASLPSVVLGFFAGLVIAPFVEDIVPAVLASFYLVPLMLLVGAFLWQLMPYRVTIVREQWRLAFMVVALFAGVAIAYLIGPVLESLFFGGDFRRWTDGRNIVPYAGSGVGGWLFLLTPISALAVTVIITRYINPALRDMSSGWNAKQCASFSFMKFGLGVAATFGLALILSYILVGIGWDPRGGIMDTYVQRNALIVGFIMGFAIIPIIYTISEDALSTVPEHLRSASLGSGATPWQTATRIIIPTAMSGLFSALMIGLGRAVGETMIVLMAAGNTPVLEMNIFNGFRTLSANIAVELPEAVKNSTHYRTLFLAALTLFAMTFVVNTAAEFVRQRFRKRAYQL